MNSYAQRATDEDIYGEISGRSDGGFFGTLGLIIFGVFIAWGLISNKGFRLGVMAFAGFMGGLIFIFKTFGQDIGVLACIVAIIILWFIDQQNTANKNNTPDKSLGVVNKFYSNEYSTEETKVEQRKVESNDYSNYNYSHFQKVKIDSNSYRAIIHELSLNLFKKIKYKDNDVYIFSTGHCAIRFPRYAEIFIDLYSLKKSYQSYLITGEWLSRKYLGRINFETDTVDEKTIIHCPRCRGKTRVPKNKELEITCPSCNFIWNEKT